MKTPVAFLIFKRSSSTKKVFEAIREARPPKLLVVADGPRSDRLGESELCENTRAIIEQVDWDCEVVKNYSSINLGCKNRVASGLDWVFAQVDEAIILEDDCLPHPSFFSFCEVLLERYRYDERVFHISGQNVQQVGSSDEFDYYFSRFTHCWGWASWKRSWKHYDVKIKSWPKVRQNELLDNMLVDDNYAAKVWDGIFQAVYDERIDTWDYQLQLACWMQSGLSILPSVKLVENIGFGEDGTHTTNSNHLYSSIPLGKIDIPLSHPEYMIRNSKADWYTQRTLFDYKANFAKRLANKIVNAIGN